MFGWMHNGTTVAISKKGSGVKELLDPCISRFMQTRTFLDTCKLEHGSPPHSQINSCVPNQYFADDPAYTPATVSSSPYMFPTSQMAGHQTCATGYCMCSE
jgi:hypothetical protein